MDTAMKTRQHVREKTEYHSSVSLPYIGSASHKIERILKGADFQLYHSSENKLFRSLCTHKDSVNEFQKPGVYRIPFECVWYILVKLAEISHYVLKNIRLTNCEKAELEKSAVAKHSWTNDHRIKWNEASILATESQKFSREIRESIEIEKHSTIDQEGKPLDSTWRALFTVQN